MHDTAGKPAPLMSERRVSLIGGLLVAIGPISMAMYTPAMPTITEAFATTDAAVKLTLTLYFGGFAVAQLIAGPLSDALGRKPVTFIFMGIYFIASLFALFTPTVEMLMVARFVQGVGASAGIAISRAIVRDLFTGDKSSKIMNLIGIILALGPAFSPTIGGLMLGVFGWRSIFIVMALFGLIVVVVTALYLKETVVPDRSRLNMSALVRAYGELLGNRHFLTVSGIMAGAIGALYAQATFLPFILMNEVGLTPAEFGLGMLFQSGAFFAGSLIARRLMYRMSAYRLVAPGVILIAIGSFGTSMMLFWEPGFLRVMLPIAVYAVGIAFVMPGMSTAALAPFPHMAGAAASLMGFLQMGSGLAVGTFGAWLGDPVLAIASLIPLMGLLACMCYLTYRRNPHLAEPEPRRDAVASVPPGRTFLPETSASDTRDP